MVTWRMQPGSVVVCDAGPAAPTLSIVASSSGQDGCCSLECGRKIRLENIRAAEGEAVEYFSSSLQKWIPGRVLRAGRVPGTLDLDCKESAELARVRLPWPPAGSPPSQRPVPTGDLPPTQPQMRPGSSCGLQDASQGPLALAPGECCFYRSSLNGWIPAQVVRFRSEDGTYDLSVRQQASVDSICCIRAGDCIEYQSTSSNQWIVARVLRRGSNPETFDLDCKLGVHFGRLRPAATGQLCRPAEPAPEPPSCATGTLGASQKSAGTLQPPAPLAPWREPPAFCLAPPRDGKIPSHGEHLPFASQPRLQQVPPMGSARLVPGLSEDSGAARLPTTDPKLQQLPPTDPQLQGCGAGHAASVFSAIRLVAEASSPQFGRDAGAIDTEPFLAGQRLPGESPPPSCATVDRQTEAALRADLQRAAQSTDPQSLQSAIHRATSVGIVGPEVAQAMGTLRAMGARLQPRPKSVQFLVADAAAQPPPGSSAGSPEAVKDSERQNMDETEAEDEDEPGLLTRVFGAKPTEDSGFLTRVLGPSPTEDSGLYTRVLGPGPTKGAGLVTRVLGPKPREGAGLLTRILGPEHALTRAPGSPGAVPDGAPGPWEFGFGGGSPSGVGSKAQPADERRTSWPHVVQAAAVGPPGTDPQLHPALAGGALPASPWPHDVAGGGSGQGAVGREVAVPGTDPQLHGWPPQGVPGTDPQLPLSQGPLRDTTVQELSDVRREMDRLRAEASAPVQAPTAVLRPSAPLTDPQMQELPTTAPKLAATAYAGSARY